MKSTTSIILAGLAFSNTLVLADVYFQSPPGSNNRLDEQNRERANGNRVFDSQNNNRGGYNVGKMIYYQGEDIPLDWTNQHGASKYQMENSEFIVQYMCSPMIRDGTTTRTIPTKATECYSYDCDTDVRFGRHESLEFYETCTHTARNEGLFTVNQNLKGDTAKYTRQNPQGTRHAYECPEERDYYPYWRPSPWVDALIVTADADRCAAYQAESQNVKARYECKFSEAYFDAGGNLNGVTYPLDGTACAALTKTITVTDDQGNDTQQTFTAVWNTVAAHGVEAPACKLISQTRSNHLGNPGGKNLYGTTWKIPDTVPAGSQCVMRMRYNITTADYQAWDTGASLKVGANATAAMNSNKNKPNPNNDPAEYAIWEKFGLDRSDVSDDFNEGNGDRGYVFKNNPNVDAFGPMLNGIIPNDNNGDPRQIKLQLAVNTAQFGRTFQDRTHYFFVEERPANIPAEAVIKLQTVRGKRGNIVQTFPATEYYMHPERTYAKVGEYVHFAWTGSNTNPNNNDGQGKQGTDRSNMIVQRVDQYETTKYSDYTADMAFIAGAVDTGSAMTSYPGYVKRPDAYVVPAQFEQEVNLEAFGGIGEQMLVMLGTTRQTPHDMGNMEELDDAAASFQSAPVKMNTPGCTNYLSTRNNNFSNRAQKGKFCVAAGDVGEVRVPPAGTTYWPQTGASSVTWWPDAVSGLDNAMVMVEKTETTSIVHIGEVNLQGTMTVNAEYVAQSLMNAKYVWQPECTRDERAADGSCNLEWISIEFSKLNVDGSSVASADVSNTGTFKVIQEPNPGPIIALTVAVLAFAGAIGWVLLNKCGNRCPESLHRFRWDNMRQDKGVSNPSIQTTSGKAPPPFPGSKSEPPPFK